MRLTAPQLRQSAKAIAEPMRTEPRGRGPEGPFFATQVL